MYCISGWMRQYLGACTPTNTHTHKKEVQNQELLLCATVSSSCFCRFFARISFMASSMDRVSRLLATGTGKENQYASQTSMRRQRDQQQSETAWRSSALTTAIRPVGLQRVRRILCSRGANQVTVLVFVVGVWTRLWLLHLTGRSFFQCCHFLKSRAKKVRLRKTVYFNIVPV